MTRLLWHRVRGKQTRRQWTWLALLAWMFVLLWVVLGVLLVLNWGRWPWWGKGLAGFFLTAMFPYDVGELFKSYERYEEEWERENCQGPMVRSLQAAEVRSRMDRAGRLLRDVASGACSADEALSQWPFHLDETHREVAAAVHALMHFSADADIRKKDEGYSEHTRAQLEELAKRLEAGV